MNRATWARILVILGLLGMAVGALDPLEGSVVILAGVGLVAFGAFLAKRRYRKLLGTSFLLVAVGVGAMFVTSAFGGIGGNSGRSMWWGVVMLPYPIGWITGLVGAILWLIEARRRPASPLEAA
jgi:hypothetical protein